MRRCERMNLRLRKWEFETMNVKPATGLVSEINMCQQQQLLNPSLRSNYWTAEAEVGLEH